MNKLNKKLTIIEKKLYKILKTSLKIQIYEYIGFNSNENQIKKNNQKKKILSDMIKKYLKGTEEFENENEKSYIDESSIYESQIQKSLDVGDKIDDTWIYLSLKNSPNNNK